MPVVQLNPLLMLGLLLVAGYLFGLAANRVKLPRVTGYIIAGLVLSPSVTGILEAHLVESHLVFVTDMALAIIAFAIGGSLRMSQIRALEGPILWITLTQGLGALVFASGATLAAGLLVPKLSAAGSAEMLAVMVIVGSISVATAPAAVLSIVHEARAKGPLTTTLLGTVALDDGLTIILFSWAMTTASALQGTGLGSLSEVRQAGIEIGGALAAGLMGGLLLCELIKKARRPEVHLVAVLGLIFLVNGVSLRFGLSALLANMMMGFVIANRFTGGFDPVHQLEQLEEPIYCLFFSLAGAHFDLGVISTSASLGLLLLAGRAAGKMLGTSLGARISRAPRAVRRFLGATLLPQAGLSLGLILLARPLLPVELYDLLLNAILVSVMVNELVAPPLVKWALKRAGESKED